MKLYYSPGACSLAPHIIIREAGLDIALSKIDLRGERLTEDGRNYFEINPQGSVPALEFDDGQVLTEAQVVLQYLAAQAPAKNLAPSEGFQRWRLLETLNFIATELHKGISPLFRKPDDHARKAIVETVSKRFALLDRKLGDNDYLNGSFSIADAYAFVTLNWARRFEIPVTPKLEVYFERVRTRPAVQQALLEEGLPTA